MADARATAGWVRPRSVAGERFFGPFPDGKAVPVSGNPDLAHRSAYLPDFAHVLVELGRQGGSEVRQQTRERPRQQVGTGQSAPAFPSCSPAPGGDGEQNRERAGKGR